MLSNVKSLFDHVMRRYDTASLGAESESQDLQAGTVGYTCRMAPFKHKSGDAPPEKPLCTIKVVMHDSIFQWTG